MVYDAAHAEVLSPRLHPALDHQSLVGWAFTNLVWPGKRLDYLGRPMTFPTEDRDVSWIPGADDADPGQLGATSG